MSEIMDKKEMNKENSEVWNCVLSETMQAGYGVENRSKAGECIPFGNRFFCFLNCSCPFENGILSIGKYQA